MTVCQWPTNVSGISDILHIFHVAVSTEPLTLTACIDAELMKRHRQMLKFKH